MKRMNMLVAGGALAAVLSFGAGGIALLSDGSTRAQAASSIPLTPGLALPAMNPEHGKELFVSKGCVVCHSVNGVGGTDAAPLDASTMKPLMSPFDFFAKMWNHSQPMVAMQQNELGRQVTFTGQEIADIVAFVHDADLQRTFTKKDIPADVRKHLDEDDSGRGPGGMMNGQGMMGGRSFMGGGMMGGGRAPSNMYPGKGDGDD